MKTFEEIYAIAVERKGEEELLERMPSILGDDALTEVEDAFVFESMTQAVFRAGFKWYVIKAKWPGFQAAFYQFDVATVAGFDELSVDELVQDERIVRNRKKIEATLSNARWIQSVAAEHGSFAKWVAEWPADDCVGLWSALQKGGKMLGASSAPYFSRSIGKDVWLPTGSVKAALVEHGYLDAEPTGKRGLKKMQETFNALHAETERPYSHLSTVLACSTEA